MESARPTLPADYIALIEKAKAQFTDRDEAMRYALREMVKLPEETLNSVKEYFLDALKGSPEAPEDLMAVFNQEQYGRAPAVVPYPFREGDPRHGEIPEKQKAIGKLFGAYTKAQMQRIVPMCSELDFEKPFTGGTIEPWYDAWEALEREMTNLSWIYMVIEVLQYNRQTLERATLSAPHVEFVSNLINRREPRLCLFEESAADFLRMKVSDFNRYMRELASSKLKLIVPGMGIMMPTEAESPFIVVRGRRYNLRSVQYRIERSISRLHAAMLRLWMHLEHDRELGDAVFTKRCFTCARVMNHYQTCDGHIGFFKLVSRTKDGERWVVDEDSLPKHELDRLNKFYGR
jgi:hypothetical protein